jgi:hypothetical protein
MTENLFGESKSGDLTTFGLPFSEGEIEKDITHEELQAELAEGQPEVDEVPVVPGQQYTPPVQSPDQPVSMSGEEVQEEEQGEEQDIGALGRVMQHLSAGEEEQKAPSGYEAQLAGIRGELDRQMELTKEALRTVGQVAQPMVEEPQASGPDYNSPEVQAILREAVEDPGKMGHAIKTIAQLEGEATVGKQVAELKSMLENMERTQKENAQATAVNEQIALGLQQAYALGGTEADVIQQAHQLGEQSLLMQHLRSNPALALSAQGIVTAAMAIARTVERADAVIGEQGGTPNPNPAGTVVRRTPGGNSANVRGRRVVKPTTSRTDPADQLKAEIMGATGRAEKALPFLNR